MLLPFLTAIQLLSSTTFTYNVISTLGARGRCMMIRAQLNQNTSSCTEIVRIVTCAVAMQRLQSARKNEGLRRQTWDSSAALSLEQQVGIPAGGPGMLMVPYATVPPQSLAPGPSSPSLRLLGLPGDSTEADVAHFFGGEFTHLYRFFLFGNVKNSQSSNFKQPICLETPAPSLPKNISALKTWPEHKALIVDALHQNVCWTIRYEQLYKRVIEHERFSTVCAFNVCCMKFPL